MVTPQELLSTLAGLDPDNDSELQGLSAKQKAVVKERIAKAATTALRMDIAPKSVKQFISRQNQLPKAVQDKIAAGELGVEHYDMYRNIQVAPGANSITKLILENVDIDPGLTNFQGAKLPEDAHMLISAIQIGYGYDAGGAINDPRLIEYSPFGNVPICFQNAVLHVRVGQTYIIENLPLRNFFSWESGSAPTAVDRAALVYENPKDNVIWNANTKIEVNIEFPAGSTAAPYLPAGDHFLSIHLYGSGVGVTQAK